MKIILSPSKTASWTKVEYLMDKELPYPDRTVKLRKRLSKLSKPKLKAALKLSDSLVKPTYDLYHGDQSTTYHAFPSFNGLVYKQLDKDQYDQAEWEYITEHIRVLDALYGVLEPGTCIWPYRLDMKAKLGINLYDFWNINPYFKGDIVINLASKEFSNMLDIKMIDIEFYQCKHGTCKTQATYSKMGRGKMVNYMIQNNIKTIEQIKQFHEDGYQYDDDRSSENVLSFSRTI